VTAEGTCELIAHLRSPGPERAKQAQGRSPVHLLKTGGGKARAVEQVNRSNDNDKTQRPTGQSNTLLTCDLLALSERSERKGVHLFTCSKRAAERCSLLYNAPLPSTNSISFRGIVVFGCTFSDNYGNSNSDFKP